MKNCDGLVRTKVIQGYQYGYLRHDQFFEKKSVVRNL